MANNGKYHTGNKIPVLWGQRILTSTPYDHQHLTNSSAPPELSRVNRVRSKHCLNSLVTQNNKCKIHTTIMSTVELLLELILPLLRNINCNNSNLSTKVNDRFSDYHSRLRTISRQKIKLCGSYNCIWSNPEQNLRPEGEFLFLI